MPPQDPNQNQPVQPVQPVVGGVGPAPAAQSMQPTAPVAPVMPQQPMAPTVQPAPQPSVNPALNIQPTVGIQPSMQPAQPMQPVTAGMGGMAPIIPASNSNKKTILTILGGVLGVIILLVIGVYAMGAMGGVSQKDYKESLTVASEAAKAYSQIGVSYASAYSSEAEIKASVEQITSSRQTFDEKFDKLGKTKAIKQDKKLHELFDKLATKKKSFDSTVDFTIETYTYIMPAVSNYTQNYLTSKDPLKLISSVRQKLEEGQPSLKTDVNIKFIDEYTKELKTLEAAAKRYQAAPLNYDAYKAYSSVGSKIRTTTTNWTNDIRDMKDKGDIYTEFNALGTAIAAKANGAKASDSSGWIYQLPFKALTR